MNLTFPKFLFLPHESSLMLPSTAMPYKIISFNLYVWLFTPLIVIHPRSFIFSFDYTFHCSLILYHLADIALIPYYPRPLHYITPWTSDSGLCILWLYLSPHVLSRPSLLLQLLTFTYWASVVIEFLMG